MYPMLDTRSNLNEITMIYSFDSVVIRRQEKFLKMIILILKTIKSTIIFPS